MMILWLYYKQKTGHRGAGAGRDIVLFGGTLPLRENQ